MKQRLCSALLLALPLACSSPSPPAAQPVPPAAPAPASAPAPAPAPTPTPEEKAKADAAAAFDQERTKARADAQAESARFTSELHAANAALVAQKFTSLKTALVAIQKSAHRVPGHAGRDAARHPLETLQFFGVTPRSVVLEYGPGEGWFTELLAPLLYSQGQLFATTADPVGPPDSRQTFYAERFKLFLDKAPELYGKVTPLVVDPAAPQLTLEGKLDAALVFRGVHGMINAGTLDAWLAQIHRALKKGGTLGIEQHRAAPGKSPAEQPDPQATAKLGYVPEAWLINQIEAAGFKLAGKSEINANPKDTRDHPGGVWALPPTLSQGDTDREKYLAIGESDRMTLRFTRVEPKKSAEAHK